MKFGSLVFFVVLTFCGVANAAQYYVRTDGNNANTGTADTAGGAWLTVQHALNTALAGDTINVAAGTYAEDPATTRAGTAGSRITVQCNGVVNLQGFNIAHNYITWVGGRCSPGINIDADYAIIQNTEVYGDMTNDGYAVDIGTVSDNGILDGVYIHDTLPVGSFLANSIFFDNGALNDGSDGPQNWTIQNCTMENTGYQGMTIEGMGHVIQNNKALTAGGDIFRVFGQNHTIRRNYIRGSKMPASTHVDFFQTWGAAGSDDESLKWCKNILIEENMVWNPQVTTTVDVTYADIFTGNPSSVSNDDGTLGDTITRSSGSWITDGFNLTTYGRIRNGLNVKGVGIKKVTDTVITVGVSNALTAGSSSAVKFYGVPSMQVCQMDEGNPNMSGIVFNRNVFVNVMGAANNQGVSATWTNNTFVEGAWNVRHIGGGGSRPARSRIFLQQIPSEGETITLDTTTYTWTATADTSLEMQIGGTIEACRNAFYNAVMGLDGRNSVHPTIEIPSKVQTPVWSNAGAKDDTSVLVQAVDNLSGLVGVGLVTTETMAGSGNYLTESTLMYGADAINVFKNNIFFGCGRQDGEILPSHGWYNIQNVGQGVTVTANYNFVANLDYSTKTSGTVGNTDFMKFYEPNGRNGGNPLFVNASNPLGADNLVFTADDGLRLQAGSTLLGAGEGGADIGAYGEGAALPAGSGTVNAATTNAGTVTIQ